MEKEISTWGNIDSIIPMVIDKVTKTTEYNDSTESGLARLAAQDDDSPIRNITRSSCSSFLQAQGRGTEK